MRFVDEKRCMTVILKDRTDTSATEEVLMKYKRREGLEAWLRKS